MTGRPLTPVEVAAIRVLAKGGRVLVILVPDGVDADDVRTISREVNERLDELVRLRGYAPDAFGQGRKLDA